MMADCGDSSSTSSSVRAELSDDDSETSLQSIENVNEVFPWRFELRGRQRNDADNNINMEEGHHRMNNDDWCTCENCDVECRCCQEIQEVKNKLDEAVHVERLTQPPSCITNHPAFLAVCTNIWVLQTAWLQYKQHYGSKAYDGPDYKTNRHIAYRQLARWCWGYLGRENRVVLPSCAVMCIRQHFPAPGLEEDFVFTGFRYADE